MGMVELSLANQFFELGFQLLEVGNYNSASETFVNAGKEFDKLGQYEQALISYDKAIELNPNDDSAWDKRGVVLERLGQYEQALISHDKAIEPNPNDESAWDNRGVALFRFMNRSWKEELKL